MICLVGKGNGRPTEIPAVFVVVTAVSLPPGAQAVPEDAEESLGAVAVVEARLEEAQVAGASLSARAVILADG